MSQSLHLIPNTNDPDGNNSYKLLTMLYVARFISAALSRTYFIALLAAFSIQPQSRSCSHGRRKLGSCLET